MSTRHLIVLAFGAILAVLTGCREKLIPDSIDYVEYGWELWQEENYRVAMEQFGIGKDMDNLSADAWNGLGWSYAALGSADTSEARFTSGSSLNDASRVGAEILAGRSFARLALGSYAESVADAKAALAKEPLWVFYRDSTMTFEHLYLNAATAFYGQGEFDSSYVWVRKLVPTFEADVSTLAGRKALADRLQVLDQSY